MKHITGKPDPLDFPEPPMWATFIPTRTPQFKVHKRLTQAKNALSGKMTAARTGGAYRWCAPCDMWVYIWDPEEDRWVLYDEVAEGSVKDTHRLWVQKGDRKAKREVPQKVVDKTIASILKSAQDG